MKLRYICWGLLLLCMGIGLTGCGKTGGDVSGDARGAEVIEEDRKDGSMRVGRSAGMSTTEGSKEEENREEDKTHLSIYYSGEDVNWVSTLVELGEGFMRDEPGIVLDMEFSEAGIYTENLKAKEAMDEFPDIFEIQDPYMFAEAGKLMRIPDAVSSLVEDPVRIEGQAYAVPLYTTTYGILYNQVIFKKYGLKEPRTYQEFLELCETIDALGIAPLAIGGSKAGHMSYWLNYFFQTDVIASDPKWQGQRNALGVSFQDPLPTKMMAKYKQLMTSDYVLEDSINMNDNQIVSHMLEGDAAMIYTGPWMFAQFIDAYPACADSDKNSLGKELEEDSAAFRLGWFFMPDEQGESVAVSECGAEWAISKACEVDGEKREAAVKFFQYLYHPVNYRKILQAMYAIPTTVDAILYPAPVVQQGLLVDYRYAAKSSVYLGNNESPEGFLSSMYPVLNSVATNVISNRSALRKLDEIWDNKMNP